ncbi:Z-ring formation inhibitor MciZ [Rossellomorea vietnamensis]|uniref:Z-ring formation inhibitor MciZ n=1 Tax=Rossellomorea vietnamensis TaxID=218284 RepID=A0A5D4MFF5_9BACI|nr:MULTISPECIES: Z-ring formation inhibitor MciZ [Bacillaceae]TYS00620.1 Z-ring formation inhibitor MciZ [Rossellomorea vietnamensis]
MKVIVRPNGFILSGKAWEVRAKLKEYSKKFETVAEWIKASENMKQ